MRPKPLDGLHIGLILLALANMIPAVEVEESWGLYAIALAAAAASLFMTRPDGANRMPPRAVQLFVFAATAFLVWEMFAPREEPTIYIVDLAHFMMFLACCKFFELRAYRDYGLVALIALLLLVISGFVSGSPIFALIIIFDLTFGLAWLLKFQSVRAADRLARSRRIAFERADIPPPPLDPITEGAPVIRRLAAPAGYCAATMIVLTSALFVTVPRGWSKGLFMHIQGVVPASVTGFSPQITLEDQVLNQDETPVMKVRFRGRGLPPDPEAFFPYMRGGTFDRYENGRWRPMRRRVRTVLVDEAGGASPLTRLGLLESDDGVIDQEVWLDNPPAGTLFSLYPSLVVSTKQVDRLRLRPDDLTLTVEDLASRELRYTMRSAPDLPLHQRLLLDPPPESPRRPSRRSVIHSDVRKYALDLLKDLEEPTDPLRRRQVAQRICDHLAGSGEFEYTLNRNVRDRRGDAVRDFLLVHKRGHCEFFASAMTVLCQAVEVPARIVNGFAGGQYDPSVGVFVFRQRDAHAWVEVFVADEGWITFDPSPIPHPRLERDENGLLAAAGRWLDLLRYKWSTHVVAFDAESWAYLAQGVSLWFEGILKREGDAGASVTVRSILWGPDILPLWQRFFYWLLLVLVVTLVVLVLRALGIISIIIKEHIVARRRLRSRVHRRADAQFYDRLLMHLADRGHAKLDRLSPREFAWDLAAAFHDFSEMPLLTEWFYEAQYGRKPLTRAQSTRIRAFLSRLREDSAFGAR